MHKAVLLTFAILVAGCASEGPAEAPPMETMLTGVVVDNAITPIGNATVAVVGTNLTMQTDTEGHFAFVVDDGAYTLHVSKAGFVTTEQPVTVNGSAAVQVTLEPVPVPVPTSSVKEWTGIIQCSVRTPSDAYALCKLADDLTGVVGEDADERYRDIDTPPTYVQVEMEWTSTQPAGSSLRLMLTDDHREGTDNYAVATGPSPLMVAADNGTLQFKHLDTQGLYIRVYTGDFQAGFSLTVQQTFTVYTSVFQDMVPDPDWRFTDGNGLP